MSNAEQIIGTICQLYRDRAYHIKRGFCINESTDASLTNHLIEEAVEVQSEVLCGTSNALLLEELADLFLVFCHLLQRQGFNFHQVVNAASSKLRRNWTTDISQITALKPGFTRSGRKDG